MTQHSDKLEQRKEELLQEQMDKTWTSIYSQWDKRDPNADNYMRINYASGREVTIKSLATSSLNDEKSEWKHVTYKEPMRRWLFKKGWFK